jgi:hypothetical protein
MVVRPAPSPARSMARSGTTPRRAAVVYLVDSADDALLLTASAPPDVDVDAIAVTSVLMEAQVRQAVAETNALRRELGQPPIRLIDRR